MSMTESEFTAHEPANYGGFVDAVGGIATIVLAIIGLAGLAPSMILGVVIVVFGAALLIQGSAMLADYARIIFPPGTTAAAIDQFGGNGSLSAIFIGGAVGMVLGVLGLLGVHLSILAPVAVIVFGSVMAMSSNSAMNLQRLKTSAASAAGQSTRTGGDILAAEMASTSAGIQAIAGFAAVVLGILAVVGTNASTLSLVALLALGAALALTGSTLSSVVLNFMRPMARSRQ